MEPPNKKKIKLIMLHNFSNREISLILSQVKSLYPNIQDRQKLVFTKTTEQSKKMQVQELIDDASEDHLYLLKNPPKDNPACTLPKQNKQSPEL